MLRSTNLTNPLNVKFQKPGLKPKVRFQEYRLTLEHQRNERFSLIKTILPTLDQNVAFELCVPFPNILIDIYKKMSTIIILYRVPLKKTPLVPQIVVLKVDFLEMPCTYSPLLLN